MGSYKYIAHHGIKGMHWGEWNDETQASYKRERGAVKKVSENFKTSSDTLRKSTGKYVESVKKNVVKYAKNAIGLPNGVNLPSNWKQMSSSEKGQFMNSVTDRTISGKSSGRYPEGSKETSDQMWKRLESDPGYIKVKDKSKSGNGGHALVKIENKATAATSLSYLGYSDKEIAKILGVSVEILREMK